VRQDADHLIARLGYETREDSDLYDPVAKDFKHEAVIRGRTVTFAVRLADLAIVYERRRAGMSEREFTAGLQFLLRAADVHRKWIVAPVDSRATFDDWVRGVDLVHRFRFRAEGLRLPRDPGSPVLGALLIPRSGTITIDARASDGVDITDDLFRELVRLASDGSGEVFAVGRKNGNEATGMQKAWESANSAERVVQEIVLDPDSGEASEPSLLKVLAAMPLDPPW
jgi:hypothetical protein